MSLLHPKVPINAIIKRKCQFKSHDLISFVNKPMFQVFRDQEEKIRTVFVGQGDYELAPAFAKFHKGESWFDYTPAQRSKIEKEFYAAAYTPCVESVPLQMPMQVPTGEDGTRARELKHDWETLPPDFHLLGIFYFASQKCGTKGGQNNHRKLGACRVQARRHICVI